MDVPVVVGGIIEVRDNVIEHELAGFGREFPVPDLAVVQALTDPQVFADLCELLVAGVDGIENLPHLLVRHLQREQHRRMLVVHSLVVVPVHRQRRLHASCEGCVRPQFTSLGSFEGYIHLTQATELPDPCQGIISPPVRTP